MNVRHPLVDREREVRAIDEALCAAARGSGSTLAVRAGLGAGKTALLLAADGLARARGFTVLHTHGCFPDRGSPLRTACRLFETALLDAADHRLDVLFERVLRAAGEASAEPDEQAAGVAMRALDE